MDNARNTDEFLVQTPVGTLRVARSPDKDNPGVFVIALGPDGKEISSALFEFDQARSALDLKIWSYENPESDPALSFPMSHVQDRDDPVPHAIRCLDRKNMKERFRESGSVTSPRT